MYRVEDKYLCDETDMCILESRISAVLQSDLYQKGKVGYKVTSMYFDDLFDTHLFDTQEGFAQRDKYRIRIYDNSFKTIKLEVKHKHYNRIYKESASITEEELWSLSSGKCIEEQFSSLNNAKTLFNLAIKNRGLRPKVIVEYDRNAYIYGPGNVRITFDRNVRASDQFELFGDIKCDFEHLDENQDVLEVKYDEFLPEFIPQLLENSYMLQTSFSKYQLCRERIEKKCL